MPVQCPVCYKTYKARRGLKIHLLSAHHARFCPSSSQIWAVTGDELALALANLKVKRLNSRQRRRRAAGGKASSRGGCRQQVHRDRSPPPPPAVSFARAALAPPQVAACTATLVDSADCSAAQVDAFGSPLLDVDPLSMAMDDLDFPSLDFAGVLGDDEVLEPSRGSSERSVVECAAFSGSSYRPPSLPLCQDEDVMDLGMPCMAWGGAPCSSVQDTRIVISDGGHWEGRLSAQY